MILFQTILSILFFVRSVFGGSSSYCASYRQTFAILSNKCNEWIDFSASQMNENAIAYPALARGSAYNHECKVDKIMGILANGTARIFQNDALLPYIVKILNDEVEMPFQSPLDCIEIELKQMSEKRKASKKFAEENIVGSFVAPDVKPDAWCSTLQLSALSYYNALRGIIDPQVNEFENSLPIFASIGMKDLLENYVTTNKECDFNGFLIGSADIVGASHDEALSYASDTSTELTYPLSCIKIIVDLGFKQIDSAHTECETLSQRFVQNSFSNPSSACGNLRESFGPLKNAALDIFNKMENYTLSNSIAYPVLMPAYVNELNCKLQDLAFAISHATETVTGISWRDIFSIFLGFSQPPYSDQLNCIIDDLNEVLDKAKYLTQDYPSILAALGVSLAAFDDQSCFGIMNGVLKYYEQIQHFINGEITEMQAQFNTFKAINLGNNFIDIINPYGVCVKYGITTVFSTLLNTTYDDTLNVIDSAVAKLNPSVTPGYPFDCVMGIIYSTINYTNQEFGEFRVNVTSNIH